MHEFDQCGKRNVCVTNQQRGVGTFMNMLHFNVVVFCFVLFFDGLASCKWGHREITEKKKKKKEKKRRKKARRERQTDRQRDRDRDRETETETHRDTQRACRYRRLCVPILICEHY